MDYPLIKLNNYQVEEINKFNNNSNIKFEKTLCLNCLSNENKILFKNDRYGFKLTTVICKRCGLIFSNPRMTKDATDYFYKSDIYRNLRSCRNYGIHPSSHTFWRFAYIFFCRFIDCLFR